MKLILLCLFITTTAFGHGGRTDSSGCHNDYKNGGYHCHKADETSKEATERNPASAEREITEEEKQTERSFDLKK